MLTLEYSCDRIETILEQISVLEQSEFPYEHSREGLQKIRILFENRLNTLQSHPSDSDPEITRTLCATILGELFFYVPLLGFILGSTDVRNAFEVYPPLLRLSQQILGHEVRLILSSEWRGYSPFTYPEITGLPNFVLIGLPAPESQNPLLIPLAGHELGHNVWRANSLARKYLTAIEKDVLDQINARFTEYKRYFHHHNLQPNSAQTNIFVHQTLAPFIQYALKQTEEYFCDFTGLYIFDEAYFHAFSYLIAPGAAHERSVHYPNFGNRVTALISAAEYFRNSFAEGYSVPEGYVQLFKDQAEPSVPGSPIRFLLSLADHASAALTQSMMQEVRDILSTANVPQLSRENLGKVLETFRFVVPSLNANNLSEILNAAWNVYHDPIFWEASGINSRPRRIKILKELVLKAVEVLEIKNLVEVQ